MVHEAQARLNDLTILSENFDPSIFTQIYAEKRERERLERERRQRMRRVTNAVTDQLRNGQAPPNAILGFILNMEDYEDDDIDEGSDLEAGAEEDERTSVEGEGVIADAL